MQVAGDVVVHGQLHAEAVAVGEHHDPSTVIFQGGPHVHVGLGAPQHKARLAEVGVVAIRGVDAEDEAGHANDNLGEGRDPEGHAPGDEVGVQVTQTVVDGGHDQVGDAGTGVTPACSQAVGGAHDADVEHGGDPELAGHEGRQGEPDDHSHGDEGPGIGHNRHTEGGRGGEQLEEAVAVARAEGVADDSHQDAGEDGAGDGGNVAGGKVLLGKVQVVANDDQKGSSCGKAREDRMSYQNGARNVGQRSTSTAAGMLWAGS